MAHGDKVAGEWPLKNGCQKTGENSCLSGGGLTAGLCRPALYTKLIQIFWSWTCIPKMNFLGQRFQKSITDRQTDRQTDATEDMTTPHSRMVTTTATTTSGTTHGAKAVLCLSSFNDSVTHCDCVCCTANARSLHPGHASTAQSWPKWAPDAYRPYRLSVAATVTVRRAWSDATVATFHLAESRRRYKCCPQHGVSFQSRQGFLNSGACPHRSPGRSNWIL